MQRGSVWRVYLPVIIILRSSFGNNNITTLISPFYVWHVSINDWLACVHSESNIFKFTIANSEQVSIRHILGVQLELFRRFCKDRPWKSASLTQDDENTEVCTSFEALWHRNAKYSRLCIIRKHWDNVNRFRQVVTHKRSFFRDRAHLFGVFIFVVETTLAGRQGGF